MKQKTAKFIFEKILGWKADAPVAPVKKCLILGVPHTTLLDFPLTFLYYRSVGGNMTILVKEKFFFFPLGCLLRKMGGVPLSKKVNTMIQIVNLFNNSEECHYGMAPEGTRSPVKHWRTGFHYIARKAGVPVYLGYIDYKHKRISRGEPFELTDDAEADLRRMQGIYKNMDIEGLHPEKVAYLDD
ncbi:MAG: 1-acyl-sn-glycerol-3-phosphate acyltransferase [Bacteroidales bacterium]|nr:1-acyl-sn-glycerol-3-phosphate acyltransferase [Bacteroidales bacterium]